MQYGQWEMAVDVEKTRAYYRQYEMRDTQAHRNFAKYCSAMPAAERAFFEAFGIDPLCCEIESIGVSREGGFPCGGYYLFCGEYVRAPEEAAIPLEELRAGSLLEEAPDTRVNVGIFQFDFQKEGDIFCEAPAHIPPGFQCVQFWCEEMRWLLEEPCEEEMYEPPKFWQLSKKFREAARQRQWRRQERQSAREQAWKALEARGIAFSELTAREVAAYRKAWLRAFRPDGASMRELYKKCLPGCGFFAFLWHLFSFAYVECIEGNAATAEFFRAARGDCVLLLNIEELGFRMKNAHALDAPLLEAWEDITITAENFAWTYSKTHEPDCGPYFYRR